MKIITWFLICVSLGLASSGVMRMKIRYYISYPSKKTWNDAMTDCKNRNMSLVDIETQEIEDELLAILNARGQISEMRRPHFWTSGTDKYSEGEFYWKSTGRRISYTNWRKGEPNNMISNIETENYESENCLEAILTQTIRFRAGLVWRLTWNDDKCSAENYYICRGSVLINRV